MIGKRTLASGQESHYDIMTYNPTMPTWDRRFSLVGLSKKCTDPPLHILGRRPRKTMKPWESRPLSPAVTNNTDKVTRASMRF